VADVRARRVAWSFVAAQFALIAVLVLVPLGLDRVPPLPVRVAGWVLVAAGVLVAAAAAVSLGRALTASPIPTARGRLRTDGLFALVRHPIYTGLLTAAAGVVLVTGNPWRLAVAVGLAALITAKARWEERRLAERFPDYPEYAARTPRFVPGVRGVFSLLRRRAS
jgi:protein-S-isoprenylcysteine O-methyltransferase Ste14